MTNDKTNSTKMLKKRKKNLGLDETQNVIGKQNENNKGTLS